MRSCRRGYTYLETVMVLSVAGTAAGMVLPEVTRTISHARVNNAASMAAGDLELASSLAFRAHRPLRLVVNAAERTITVTDRSSGAVLTRRHLGSRTDLKLETVIATPDSVDIFPNGTTSQSLTLGLPGYTRLVTLSRSGMVRVSP